MTGRQRERASAWIRKSCEAWVVVEIWPALIDRFNILGATRLAMRTAARSLSRDRTAVVVDAVRLDVDGVDARCETKADERYFCVASASIVAKVHRDRIMVELASRYHGWGWERNKGYGTEEHRGAMDVIGQSFLHRKSFHWRRVLP
jgi:ribonuclease HII